MQVRAQQGDTVDRLVNRHLGQTSGLVEQTLLLNPSLANYGPILPVGLLVTLPDNTKQAQAAQPVQLWD